MLAYSIFACAQDVTVTARVAWANSANAKSARRAPSDVVVWLTPAEGSPTPTPTNPAPPRLVQKSKIFEPHLLVVAVGSVVEFPNHDPFFHNVFSLFEGKRFDLGLYEAGSTREVHFNKSGISYIFCNIHPEMSAVIIALNTPYYTVSDTQGQIVIPHVPVGRYNLHIWYEGVAPEALEPLTRTLSISDRNSTLGALLLKPATQAQPHKNKYGRDYEPPHPDSPAYHD